MYRSGFVDLDGKEVVPLVYDEVGYHDPEGKRLRVGNGDEYSFLDELAQVAIPIQYEYAEIFDKGKARVMLTGASSSSIRTGRSCRNSLVLRGAP